MPIEPPDAPKLPSHETVSVRVIAMPVKGLKTNAKPKVMAKHLRQFEVVPLIDRKQQLIGLVQSQGDFHNNPTLVTLSVNDTVNQAVEKFAQTDLTLIPIVDHQGQYSGECASGALLWKLQHNLLRPNRVGGMATPLGVYMTSGYYMGGAGWPGLVASGVLFGVFMHLLDWLMSIVYSVCAALFPYLLGLPETDQLILQGGLLFMGMLMLVRFSPIAGLHAAEHMTINALEDGLELTPDVVRLQPRVHLRCGTNLMVLLGGTQLLLSLAYLNIQEGRLSWLGVALFTLVLGSLIWLTWRKAGLWLQEHFTTKPPNEAQLASGLKAAQELLAQFNRKPHANPTIWQKIWGSGLPPMLASFILTVWLVNFLLEKIGHWH